MLIIPAIDLYKGKVVRLTRGDPSCSKIYSDNPVEVAKRWQSEGASLLHVVDLSAALGEGSNAQAVKDILEAVNIDVEVGGGVRDIKTAKEYIDAGALRVIIGTKGLDEDFLNNLMQEVGKEKIVVGVDVIDSCMAIEGWKTTTDFNGLDFIAYLQLKGVQWIIYTDISRDGTLDGVNFEEIQKLSLYREMSIIFAGGISSMQDLKKIKENAPFVKGVISGKAIYEGKINLKDAVSFLQK